MGVKESFSKNPLPYVVQGLALGILIINLFLASKLSPVVQDLAVLKNQVNANDIRIDLIVKPIADRLDRIEALQTEMNRDIKELIKK